MVVIYVLKYEKFVYVAKHGVEIKIMYGGRESRKGKRPYRSVVVAVCVEHALFTVIISNNFSFLLLTHCTKNQTVALIAFKLL